MIRATVAFLIVFLCATRPASADDYCIEYKCKDMYGGNQVVYRGVEVTGFETQRGLTCACQRQVHTPTADEIAAALASRITDAVIKGISEGTKNALKEINEANAKREKEIYDRMIELQKQNDAQLKVI